MQPRRSYASEEHPCQYVREVLLSVYFAQMKIMEKDGQVNFNDHFNFASLMASSPGWKNFVDDGPE